MSWTFNIQHNINHTKEETDLIWCLGRLIHNIILIRSRKNWFDLMSWTFNIQHNINLIKEETDLIWSLWHLMYIVYNIILIRTRKKLIWSDVLDLIYNKLQIRRKTDLSWCLGHLMYNIIWMKTRQNRFECFAQITSVLPFYVFMYQHISHLCKAVLGCDFAANRGNET